MRDLWYFWAGDLTKEDCEKIKTKCEAFEKVQGTIFKNNLEANNVRNSTISWVKDSEIKDLIMSYAEIANRESFGFDIQNTWDIQYTEYDGRNKQKYDWHQDVDWSSSSKYDRKLSIVIQLSDEKDYEGGNFEFKEASIPDGMRTQGSVLVFPSYLVHRVSPVTKGIRHSLVSWIEGPNWR